MAKRGPKAKPPHLHVLQGTYRPDRHGEKPDLDDLPVKKNGIEPVKKLNKSQQAIWDKLISPATWLTEFDVISAHMFVALTVEFQKSSANFIASRYAQLRALQSELGLNYLNSSATKPETKPNDKFFD